MTEETPCVCCCRPLSEHNHKRQCPETTYYTSGARPSTPPAVSDDLVEEVERVIHKVLSRANVMAYLDMPHETPNDVARAILPIIQRREQQAAEAMRVGPSDVEMEAALTGEGIYTWGPDGDRFLRMFAAVMAIRALPTQEN